MRRLRSYHCADRDGRQNDSEAPEVMTFVKADMPEVPRVKNKKEFDKAVADLNKELEQKRAEAYAALNEEMAQRTQRRGRKIINQS